MFECIGCHGKNCPFCKGKAGIRTSVVEGHSVKYNPIYCFRPFEYIVKDFNNIEYHVNGFFPSDVRKHCNFNIMKIEGPIVKGFGSWVIHQLVNKGE